MTEHTAQLPPQAPMEAADAPLLEPAPKSGRWSGRKGVAGALVLALLIGGGVGAAIVKAATDPTNSDEYRALADDLGTTQQQLSSSKKQAEEAADEVRRMEAEVADRKAELDSRDQELTTKEEAVAAREKAVTAVEQVIAANSIEQGTWTVGRDISPGTYRTKEAITGDCYWAIFRSGTNGSDIVDNDIPNGGFPTVTLSQGQDFENNGCGTFVKQ